MEQQDPVPGPKDPCMTRQHHVVYLLHSLGRGGTENGVVNLLNRMDHDRFRFTIALVQRERSMLERVERAGVDVVTVGKRWGNDPLFPIKLTQLFRKLKPDLVHTRGFACIEGIPAARLAGVPAIVHSEHGRDVDEAHRMKPRRAALRRILYPMADVVMTVSDELRNSILAQVKTNPGKLVCLPNGVDLERFRAMPTAAASRRLLGLPETGLMIGSVGRHDPVKDYGSLLRAFARLRTDHAGLGLVLCGDGPQHAALRDAATALGVADDVHFLGFRDDIANVLSAIDLFVLPSLTEGMSNALLEAMASGLPCVATEVGGNGEILEHGRTGFLVPPSDPERLRAALRRLVDSEKLARRMGDAGRLRVATRFSLDAMIARYEDLYLGTLARSSRQRPDVVPVLPQEPPAEPAKPKSRAARRRAAARVGGDA